MTAPMIPTVSPNVSSQVVAQQAQPQTSSLATFLLALRQQQDNEARTRIDQAQQQAQAQYQQQMAANQQQRLQAEMSTAAAAQASKGRQGQAIQRLVQPPQQVQAAPTTDANAPGLAAPINVPAPTLQSAMSVLQPTDVPDFMTNNKPLIDEQVKQRAQQALSAQIGKWLMPTGQGDPPAAAQLPPARLQALQVAYKLDPLGTAAKIHDMMTAAPTKLGQGEIGIDPLTGQPLAGMTNEKPQEIGDDAVLAKKSLFGNVPDKALSAGDWNKVFQRVAYLKSQSAAKNIDPLQAGLAGIDLDALKQQQSQATQAAQAYGNATHSLKILEQKTGSGDPNVTTGYLAKFSTANAAFFASLGFKPSDKSVNTTEVFATIARSILPALRMQISAAGAGVPRLNQTEIELEMMANGNLATMSPKAIVNVLQYARDNAHVITDMYNARVVDPRYEQALPGFGRRMQVNLNSYVVPSDAAPNPGTKAGDWHAQAMGDWGIIK